MDFTGRYAIDAPPQKVWEGLNDAAILRVCIPGCEQLDKLSPTEFVATARLKIGPLSATFKGKVTLSELAPPNRCRLSGAGQGGVAGFAKGDAEVILTADGTGTVLTYSARASVGGKLAQIGSRLIDATARKMADEFFTRFAAAVGTGAPAPAAAPSPGAAPAPSSAAPPMSTPVPSPADRPATPEGKRVPPFVWAAILTGLVAVLLYLYARG